MDEPVRVGILGAGGIAAAHAPGFKQPNARGHVTAVAEPDRAKWGRARELFGGDVALYEDYAELIADADVDAVDILLPHHMHMPAALAAAGAGLHVMTEKVMARNIHECDRMMEACEAAGVTLTVCHDRRYHAGWRALKRVVESGLPGEIVYWKLDHNQDVNPGGSAGWIATREGIGGGAIMSCLTHQIDALRWCDGEVSSVTCMTKVIPSRMEGETIGVMAARMASGALAQLSINWITRQNRGANGLYYEMAQVCGTRGEAYFMSGRGTFARTHDGSAVRDFVDVVGEAPPHGFARVEEPPGLGHATCVVEWLKRVRGEPNQITTTGRDARATVEVAEAAYRSEESDRVIELPIEPRPWEPGPKQ